MKTQVLRRYGINLTIRRIIFWIFIVSSFLGQEIMLLSRVGVSRLDNIRKY